MSSRLLLWVPMDQTMGLKAWVWEVPTVPIRVSEVQMASLFQNHQDATIPALVVACSSSVAQKYLR
jgi:hypothetical protein